MSTGGYPSITCDCERIHLVAAAARSEAAPTLVRADAEHMPDTRLQAGMSMGFVSSALRSERRQVRWRVHQYFGFDIPSCAVRLSLHVDLRESYWDCEAQPCSMIDFVRYF